MWARRASLVGVLLAVAVVGGAPMAWADWGQIGDGAGSRVPDQDPPEGQFRFAVALVADPASGPVFLLDHAVNRVENDVLVLRFRISRFRREGVDLVFDRRSALLEPPAGMTATNAERAMVFDRVSQRLYVYYAPADGVGLGKVLAYAADTLAPVEDAAHGIVGGVVPLDLNGDDGSTADDLVAGGGLAIADSIALSPDGNSMYISGALVEEGGTKGAVYRFSTATWARDNRIGTGRTAAESPVPASLSPISPLVGVLPNGDVLVKQPLYVEGVPVVKRFHPDGTLVADGIMKANQTQLGDPANPETRGTQLDSAQAAVLSDGSIVGVSSSNLASDPGQRSDRAVALSSPEPPGPSDPATGGVNHLTGFPGAGALLRVFGANGTGRCQFGARPTLFAGLDDGTVYVLAGNTTPAIRRFGFGGSECVGAGLTNRPPQGSFGVSNATPFVDEEVSFDASSVRDPDGSVEQYEWDLDGDPSTGQDGFEADGERASATYRTPGPRTVRLRATDNVGQAAIVTQPIEVLRRDDGGPDPPTDPPPGPGPDPGPGPSATPAPSPAPTAAPRLGDRSAPRIALAPRSVRARRGAITVTVTCPRGESRCSGTLTLGARDGKGKRARAVTIARGRFTAAGGKRATVTLKLSSKGRSMLRKSRRLNATVAIRASDAAGNTATANRALTIRR